MPINDILTEDQVNELKFESWFHDFVVYNNGEERLVMQRQDNKKYRVVCEYEVWRTGERWKIK